MTVRLTIELTAARNTTKELITLTRDTHKNYEN